MLSGKKLQNKFIIKKQGLTISAFANPCLIFLITSKITLLMAMPAAVSAVTAAL